MITNAYAIYDVKTLTFGMPWFQQTHGAATRVLHDLANDLNTYVGRHPADYTLYYIGQFDDQKGTLLPLEIREHVMDAISLVVQPNAALFPNVENKLNGAK